MTIGKNMVKRTVYFTVVEWAAYQDSADKAGVSVSFLIRQVLAAHLDEWLRDGDET